MESTRRSLPRRDIILMPLICVLTLLVMLGGAEFISRMAYQEQTDDTCMMPDPVLGHRFKPNCVSQTKVLEGPWVENAYNACGHRSDQNACEPKQPHSVRIAVIGSSISQGYMVPFRETFAARIQAYLSRRCSVPVQVANFASIGYIWDILFPVMQDALQWQPSAVVLTVIPFDLEQNEIATAAKGMRPKNPGIVTTFFDVMKQSRAAEVAQQYVFADDDRFVATYLHYGEKANFLRVPFSPFWQNRLRQFETVVARLRADTALAGVPLILAYVPQRAQAVLMKEKTILPGVDPSAFQEAIRAIAERHGIVYVDSSTAFLQAEQVADDYYKVDGHPNGRGHEAIAVVLERRLLQGDIAGFANCHGMNGRTASAEPATNGDYRNP